MKTKIKKLVKSALLGVAMLGLAVGVQSFNDISRQNDDPYYPKVNGVYQSTPLNMEEEGITWECRENLHEDCSAQFSSPPTPTNQLPTGTIKEGSFNSL